MEGNAASVWNFINELYNDNAENFSENPNGFVSAVRTHYEGKPELFQDWRENASVRNRLVKVCCMIHDSRDTEYGNVSYNWKDGDETKNVTLFLRDSLDSNSDEVVGHGALFDRHCYVMIPIPGASNWFLDEKLTGAGSPPKRSCNDVAESSEQLPHFVAKFVSSDCENLKANTAMTLYGLVTEESPMADEEGCESGTYGSGMPNVHVISYTIHNSDDNQFAHFSAGDSVTARDILCSKLADILGYPATASFLMAHLVSKTYARPAGALPIAALPLNIVGVSDSASIVDFMRHLYPKVKYIELTPQLLSDALFAPAKDYASDMLKTGELQVSNGTIVILDETKLPEGAFPVGGHVEKNLKALEQYILEQRLSYDYQFNQISFEVDAPILILSKRISRLLKTPFIVPMAPMQQSIEVIKHLSDGIDILRKYIQATRSRIREVTLDGEVSKKIQESSVELMKVLPAEANKSDLMSSLLLLTRILAAASGSDKILLDHFYDAVKLEEQRKEILSEWSKQSA